MFSIDLQPKHCYFRWSNLLRNAFKMSPEKGENQRLLDAYNLIYNPWGVLSQLEAYDISGSSLYLERII
jgi:hypothetical protein